MEFLLDYKTLEHKYAWWHLAPDVIVNCLGALGFEETWVTYDSQTATDRGSAQQRLYTVVGKRTRDIEPTKTIKLRFRQNTEDCWKRLRNWKRLMKGPGNGQRGRSDGSVSKR